MVIVPQIRGGSLDDRPDIARQSYNEAGHAVNCLSCQRRRRSADLPGGGLVGTNFLRLRRLLFPARARSSMSRATPKFSNVGDFRVDYARLKFSVNVRRGTPLLLPKIFPKPRQRSPPWNEDTLQRVRCFPTCFSLFENCARKLAQGIYVWGRV